MIPLDCFSSRQDLKHARILELLSLWGSDLERTKGLGLMGVIFMFAVNRTGPVGHLSICEMLRQQPLYAPEWKKNIYNNNINQYEIPLRNRRNPISEVGALCLCLWTSSWYEREKDESFEEEMVVKPAVKAGQAITKTKRRTCCYRYALTHGACPFPNVFSF